MAQKTEEPIRCPKCQEMHGNSWQQCGGKCPMEMSPHYEPSMRDKYRKEKES
jgi:hypothetical protein